MLVNLERVEGAGFSDVTFCADFALRPSFTHKSSCNICCVSKQAVYIAKDNNDCLLTELYIKHKYTRRGQNAEIFVVFMLVVHIITSVL